MNNQQKRELAMQMAAQIASSIIIADKFNTNDQKDYESIAKESLDIAQEIIKQGSELIYE